MAGTQAVCNSFKTELFNGIHAFSTTVVRGATTADTFRAALYLASANLDGTKATYGGTVGSVADTGEVSGTGYTAGGVACTWIAPSNTSGTTFTTLSASLAWTTVTLATAFDTVLIFNNTQGNKAVAVFTFGSQTVTAGNFTLTMPTNNNTTGLLRLT